MTSVIHGKRVVGVEKPSLGISPEATTKQTTPDGMAKYSDDSSLKSSNTGSPNPKDRAGRFRPPLSLVPPGPIAETAYVFALGAEKYGPYNWRKDPVKATVYVSAAMRHLAKYLEGEELDPESRVSHLAHAAACCFIAMDAGIYGTLLDDRPNVRLGVESSYGPYVEALTENAATNPKLKLDEDKYSENTEEDSE